MSRATKPELERAAQLKSFYRRLGFDHSVAVGPDTEGFAVAIRELRQGVSGRFATVTFLGADGSVLGVIELTEK